MSELAEKAVCCRRQWTFNQMVNDEYSFTQRFCCVCSDQQNCSGPITYLSLDAVKVLIPYLRAGVCTPTQGGGWDRCEFCGSDETDVHWKVIHKDGCVGVHLLTLIEGKGT